MPKATRVLTPEEIEVKRLKQVEATRRWRERHPATPESKARDAQKSRLYREENKEKVSTAAKARRPKTRERDAAQQKAWRENNPERQKRYWQEYRKKNSERNAARDRKNYEANRDAILGQKRRYYLENREECDARKRNHTHRRRAIIRGGSAPATDREVRDFLRAATHCEYCHRPFTRQRRPTLDHFMPLSLQGPHSLENFVAACKPCNSSKGSTHPVLFASKISGLI